MITIYIYSDIPISILNHVNRINLLNHVYMIHMVNPIIQNFILNIDDDEYFYPLLMSHIMNKDDVYG